MFVLKSQQFKTALSALVLPMMKKTGNLILLQKKYQKWETMEQHAFENVNNSLKTNIYSCIEKSGWQSCNQYLNVVHFLNTGIN